MNMTIVLNVLICTLLVVLGFLARLALESWRDYHVNKALHAAKLAAAREADPQHRYRRADRNARKSSGRKLQLPREILQGIMEDIKTGGKGKAYYDHGRWIRKSA